MTLLEAVVSLAILSLVGLAALGAVGRDLDTAVRVRAALEASMLAEDRLETIRLVNPRTLRALPESLATGRFAAPFDTYEWEFDIRPVRGFPGLHDVAVTIRSAEGDRSYQARIYRPTLRASPTPATPYETVAEAGGREEP